MIKPNGKSYELTLFAFKTIKGIFTISGSNSDGTDEWRQLGTNNFHTWQRSQIYQWFVEGKISPVQEANTIDWYNNTITSKTTRHTRLK